jgi:protein-tyrosine-phosphatase
MRILVLTETDACCGPMAAAFLHDYSTTMEVVSAARKPTETIDPLMVLAMKECLIDLSGYMPRDVKTLDVSDFDKVYECPDLPAPKTIEESRQLRDFIKNETYLFFRKL